MSRKKKGVSKRDTPFHLRFIQYNSTGGLIDHSAETMSTLTVGPGTNFNSYRSTLSSCLHTPSCGVVEIIPGFRHAV